MANHSSDPKNDPKNDPRLERYLTSLEQALKPFPVSDRAEVITEIKSHVFSALERDPGTHLDAILNALGEPETVANRYLMERGLKPAKTSIHPIVKWLVIGFLGSFAMLLIFSAFALSTVAHYLNSDDKTHSGNTFLEKLMDLNRDELNVRFDGQQELTKLGSAYVHFSSGRFTFQTSSDQVLSWKCKVEGPLPTPATQADGTFNLDLSGLTAAKCEIFVPAGLKLKVDGTNGKINFAEPKYDLVAELENGMVSISPAELVTYAYDVSIGAGKLARFDSDPSPVQHTLKVHVQNGKIAKDEGF